MHRASEYARQRIRVFELMEDITQVKSVAVSASGSVFVLLELADGSHMPLMIPATEDMSRADIAADAFISLPGAEADMQRLTRSAVDIDGGYRLQTAH